MLVIAGLERGEGEQYDVASTDLIIMKVRCARKAQQTPPATLRHVMSGAGPEPDVLRR